MRYNFFSKITIALIPYVNDAVKRIAPKLLTLLENVVTCYVKAPIRSSEITVIFIFSYHALIAFSVTTRG